MGKIYHLWGETWEYSEEKLAVIEMFFSDQCAIKEYINELDYNRANSKTFVVSGDGHYRQNISINPWIYENFNFTYDFINGIVPKRVEDIIKKYNCTLNLNWKEINKYWITQYDNIRDSFGNFTKSVWNNSMNEFVNHFKQTYASELEKSKGLGFGIISNSLASHLIYASMSAKQAEKDRKQALQNANEIVGNPMESISKIVAVEGNKFYTEYIEDMLVDFIIKYLANMEKIVSEGLNIDYKDILNLCNRNEELGGEVSKKEILDSLMANPQDSQIMAEALICCGHDNDLIQLCHVNGDAFKEELSKNIEKLCYEISNKENRKIYNKPIIDKNNQDFWHMLREIYKSVYQDKLELKWDDLIAHVYTEEFNKCVEFLDELIRWNNNKEKLNFDYQKELQDVKASITRFHINGWQDIMLIFINILRCPSILIRLPENIRNGVTERELDEYYSELIKQYENYVELRKRVVNDYIELQKRYNNIHDEIKNLKPCFWKQSYKAQLKKEHYKIHNEIEKYDNNPQYKFLKNDKDIKIMEIPLPLKPPISFGMKVWMGIVALLPLFIFLNYITDFSFHYNFDDFVIACGYSLIVMAVFAGIPFLIYYFLCYREQLIKYDEIKRNPDAYRKREYEKNRDKRKVEIR